MSALTASPVLGWAFLALVVGAIVALHLWKSRPTRQVVASTWLWEIAAQRAGLTRSTWRWWLALGLALAIGALLAAVLTRPALQGFGEGSRRVVVILDDAPSMATRARDGKTRWAHAQAQARSIVGRAPGAVMLADTMGRVPSPGFVARDQALALIDELTVATAGDPMLPPLPALPDADVHLVSDGVGGFDVPSGAVVHSVFESADNVAVTRLVTSAAPGDPLQIDAFVQVFNASPTRRAVRLTLRGGERYAVSQALEMAAGEIVDATFDVSAFEGGVLAAAALTAGDALPMDDIAYAVVDAHRTKRIGLVTRGNPPLADALAALPGVQVRTTDPARYRPMAEIDAYVFDGFAPAQAPAVGALLFRPPVAPWLPTANRSATAVVIDDWDRGSAIAAGVSWNALSVRRAALWTRLPAGVESVVRSGDAALIISGRARAPWTSVGFLPGDTDLPLQPAFPWLLGQVLAQISRDGVTQIAPLGQVRVPLADAEVRDGRGRPVATRAIAGTTQFEATRPDVYTVQADGVRMQVVAGLLDTRLADVNRSRFSDMQGGEPIASAASLERWATIVLLCAALLLADWVAYTRRIAH